MLVGLATDVLQNDGDGSPAGPLTPPVGAQDLQELADVIVS